MSTLRSPLPGLSLLSLFSSRWEKFWPALASTLERRLGSVAYDSGPLPFTHTRYYDREFGTPLVRRLLAFADPLPLDELAELKMWTAQLETGLAGPDGCRLVNIDPGYLTLERLVLATGKNFTHRVYLGHGVFADLTLVFSGGRWQSLPWTFPDYAHPSLQAHLTAMRLLYKARTERNKEHAPCPKA